MAEKLGEGYIEIFGLDAKFNASMKQVQAQLSSNIALARNLQATLRSAGLGSGYALASGRGSLSGPGIGGGYGPGLAPRAPVSGGYAVGPGFGPAGAASGYVPPGGYATGRGFGPSGGAAYAANLTNVFGAIPTTTKAMGIFGPGLNSALVKRYSNMPHPTMPGLNALGKPMAGVGGGNAGMAAAAGQTNELMGLYKQVMGLYAVRVAGGQFVDAVKSGSDMIETLQKTREVFGAATGTVTNMADAMAAKFGSNKQVMLDTASVFGLIGQAAHMSERESAGMAVSMSKLAADASSFYNVPLDVALVKIQAGLVGQSRPLREFGVLLNIATVKAKAAEMGMKTLNGQFSESDKILARAQLIKEGLAKASGDMERTQDSPANVVRRLEGDWENAKAAMGMPLASVGASMLIGAREGVADYFKGAKAATGSDAFAAFASIQGIVPGVLKGLMEDESKTNSRMGVDSRMMKRVELSVESPAEKFARERQAYDQFMSDKYMRENAFKGEFGAFGMMGNLGQMFNRQAMLGGVGTTVEGLDKKIAKAQRQEWEGGHVTDPLSFMRQAQESILKPQDETQKQQLAELRAIREAIVKSTPDGKARGVVLRGRES